MPDAERDGLQQGLDGAVDRLTDTVDQTFRRAIILWGIRWTIGFAAIWGITAWTGRYGWLWLAGIVVAGLSFVAILYFRKRSQRHLAEAEAKRKKLRDALENVEDRV